VALRARAGDQSLKGAPYHAPVRRLDETRAARSPRLRWAPEGPASRAAE
jgi:glycine dehydrogenase subunit 2